MKRFNFFNLSFRKQIGVVLILSAAIPTIGITQSMIGLVRDFTEKQFQRIDSQCLLALGLLQQEIDRKQSQIQSSAKDLANRVEDSGVESIDTDSVAESAYPFKFYLKQELKESEASFTLITDAYGQVVAHHIRALQDDFTQYPLLAQDPRKATTVRYQPVTVDTIDLSTLPIVQGAMRQNRSLSGAELVSSQILAQMGLSEQATVGIRRQKVEGLPERLRPTAEGTYDTEQGKIGLALMAVQPILIEGQLVGTTIVGYLVNRNPELVDRVRHKTGIPTVTLFARDLRVSTNVPYTDQQTRAIGTRASSEVAQTVLEQGQYFQGQTNIVGSNYRTAYRPLYDHTRQLNPSSKPIGIAYVGQSLSEFESYFQDLQIRGYAIGGAATLLSIVAAILLARSLAKPVREIVRFADQVSMGQLDAQLPDRYSAEMEELANAVKRLLTSVKKANSMMARTYYEEGTKQLNSGNPRAAQQALQKAMVLLSKEDTTQMQEVQNLLHTLANPASTMPANAGQSLQSLGTPPPTLPPLD
jgi:methyl-accepting chemotaxis protein PixJ